MRATEVNCTTGGFDPATVKGLSGTGFGVTSAARVETRAIGRGTTVAPGEMPAGRMRVRTRASGHPTNIACHRTWVSDGSARREAVDQTGGSAGGSSLGHVRDPPPVRRTDWTVAMSNADWDIVTGVGATALGVAAGRAIETRRGGLVVDPYAELFLAAAAPPVPLPIELDAVESRYRDHWDGLSTYMGVRSRFFDEFFVAAGTAGVRQVVLLAAGLDARAYRLDWPDDAVVFELDAPKVLSFKDEVLDAADAAPTVVRHPVAVDLRDDWSIALRDSGFDPGRPTAWLAEGLLPFLPNDAKDSLFRRMHGLSATGSRIAAEHIADITAVLRHPRFIEMRDRFGVDMVTLWPEQPDYRPAEWLSERGWTVEAVSVVDVAARYERNLDNLIPPVAGVDPMASGQFITARRDPDPIA